MCQQPTADCVDAWMSENIRVRPLPHPLQELRCYVYFGSPAHYLYVVAEQIGCQRSLLLHPPPLHEQRNFTCLCFPAHSSEGTEHSGCQRSLLLHPLPFHEQRQYVCLCSPAHSSEGTEPFGCLRSQWLLLHPHIIDVTIIIDMVPIAALPEGGADISSIDASRSQRLQPTSHSLPRRGITQSTTTTHTVFTHEATLSSSISAFVRSVLERMERIQHPNVTHGYIRARHTRAQAEHYIQADHCIQTDHYAQADHCAQAESCIFLSYLTFVMLYRMLEHWGQCSGSMIGNIMAWGFP